MPTQMLRASSTAWMALQSLEAHHVRKSKLSRNVDINNEQQQTATEQAAPPGGHAACHLDHYNRQISGCTKGQHVIPELAVKA